MSKGREKISVVIPIYNVEDYLPECLESCVKQTLRDIEIICVDDGSTDKSGAILDQYSKLDSRIKAVHKNNGGLSSARNAGLKIANGQWIMFLDSDDFLSKNACERVWIEANEASTDIIVFGTSIFPPYPKADPWYENVLKVNTVRYRKFSAKVLFHTKGAIPFVWRQAYSRGFIDENNLQFDENIKFGEDTVFQMEAFPLGSNFSFIEDRLYNYRWIRPGSLMVENTSDNYVRTVRHINIIKTIIDNWEKSGLLKLYENDFLSWLINFVMPELEFIDDKESRKALAREIIEVVEEKKLDKAYKYLKKQTANYFKQIYKLGREN